MVDISTLSIAIASSGVLVAAIYYILQLRNQNRIRQTDLLVRLAPWLNIRSSELQQAMIKVLNLEFKDYDEFVKKYGPPFVEKPEQMAIMTVGNYFEAIGTLLKRKLLDIDLACDYWGETFTVLWEKIKPFVDGVRQEFNQPEFGDYGEYLFDEMQKRQQQLAKKLVTISPKN